MNSDQRLTAAKPKQPTGNSWPGIMGCQGMSSRLGQLPDAALWNAFRQGDEQAFAYMFQKFAPILYSYGFHLCRNRDLVEDCIQDQFIYLQQHRALLGETDSIKFYLYRSLRRRIAEMAKANARWVADVDTNQPVEFEVEMPAEAQLIDSQTQADHKQKIEFLLNQLPKRQKEALYLMYYEKLSYVDVAQVMGLEVKSVYNLIYNALVSLRKHVQETNLQFFMWVLCGWLGVSAE
jgi:RNA polymerase sigma factor (sigma-70 family)